jgi:uncharacterized repeat protein (TIGR03803 family)
MRKRQEWLTGIAIIVFLAAGGINARAQATFGVLHSFTNSTSDGSFPAGQPVLIGSTLYGVTFYGGSSSSGTVYRVSTNGAGFGVLYSFTGGANGANPYCTLVSTGASFYGMTYNGGVADGGVVFGVNTNGTGYSVLHTFLGGGGDGQYPYGSLALNGSTLYGMTSGGGSNDDGVVFSISTGGTPTFSVLHSFAGGTNDGAFPNEGVIVSGTSLYGTAYYGGTNDLGVVFAVNTAVTSNAFTILHHFAGGNNDGANPTGPLTLNGSTLYGLTAAGGTDDLGVVFTVSTNGSGYAVLHSFAGEPNDGALPQFGPLVVTNSVIYGATEDGGSSGGGVLFQMNTDGSGFGIVYGFSGGTNDGAFPAFGPLLSGSILYGVTPDGGSNDLGVIYGAPATSTPGCSYAQISAIQIVGTNVVITIPTSTCYTYQLQYSSAMVPTNWANIGAAVQGTNGPIQLIDYGNAPTTTCLSVSSTASKGAPFGNVVAGEWYSYTATGCVRLAQGQIYVDPDGVQYTTTCGPTFFYHAPEVAVNGYPCPSLVRYSLVGEVNGTCIQLGSSGLFAAPASGPLVLYFNDESTEYEGNRGSFEVCLTAPWERFYRVAVSP